MDGGVMAAEKNQEVVGADLRADFARGAPVSYTHLDVYKRQELMSVAAPHFLELLLSPVDQGLHQLG